MEKTVYDWHRQDTRMTELKDVCVTVAAAWGRGGQQYALCNRNAENGIRSGFKG